MKEHYKILIIEDELYICDILKIALEKENFSTWVCHDGASGLQKIKEILPDVILLDLMLPDILGFDVCRQVKAHYNLPIIMLTARNDIVDKVLGLEIGADDYITKPFDIREVIARIKSVIRRSQDTAQAKMEKKHIIKINDGVWMDTNAMNVYKDGEQIKLKRKEYDLLNAFAKNKDKVFTREELLDMVWSMDYEGELRTVDVHVRRLRQKLDQQELPSIIETIFGVGYRMRNFK